LAQVVEAIQVGSWPRGILAIGGGWRGSLAGRFVAFFASFNPVDKVLDAP